MKQLEYTRPTSPVALWIIEFPTNPAITAYLHTNQMTMPFVPSPFLTINACLSHDTLRIRGQSWC